MFLLRDIDCILSQKHLCFKVGFSPTFALKGLRQLRRPGDEFFDSLGDFLLGRTITMSLHCGIPSQAHGVPSPMWSGSIRDFLIPFQKR